MFFAMWPLANYTCNCKVLTVKSSESSAEKRRVVGSCRRDGAPCPSVASIDILAGHGPHDHSMSNAPLLLRKHTPPRRQVSLPPLSLALSIKLQTTPLSLPHCRNTRAPTVPTLARIHIPPTTHIRYIVDRLPDHCLRWRATAATQATTSPTLSRILLEVP